MYRDINITKHFIPDQNLFTSTLSNQLSELANATGNSEYKYKTNSLKLNDIQTLYTLEQCTEILNSQECISCLNDMISTQIPWSFLGSVGGRIIYPNCNLRFELFQFYLESDDRSSRNPSKEAEKRKVISIVVPTIILAMLLSIGYYLLKGRGRKNRRTILRDNFGKESVILEPLQFDWAVIEAATNNFSKDNYIGEGGFGEVYKGILLDGQEVAMKRLSRGSKQGVEEFKNEVLLIAKLQHRNLVTFIGFCLEGHENILIYEFVPNKSLDYFLFDCHHQKLLTWVERFNIIGGIVRGILYLHEHSRLKVIHRDLKPSNILLDENMIPKISDFGLARIMEISQDEGSTNRIVGTYGYMAPEYAMLGQFSEKSDVYSFGVMLLEIVAGKKNISSYAQRHVADNLLNYVWRQWNDQTPLSILDPKIKEDYSEKEFIKCIQIGLLCVQRDPDARPSMVTIASYLSSYSIELPTPQEPAFFLHDRTFSNVAAQGSSSTQFVNSSSLLSINQMSTTNTFSPR
jgi:serine/threonine protein kinase